MRCNVGKMLTPSPAKSNLTHFFNLQFTLWKSPTPTFTDLLENAPLTVKVREERVCKNYGGVPLCTFPALNYLFKVDFGNTITMCEIC